MNPAAATALRALFLLSSLVTLAGCAVLDPRQTDPPPPGIARVETLTVDGLPERLLIRGNDPAHNPVLLFVHGGPGFPGAPFRQVNSDLEKYFTVVHWDQRAAGYSYFKGIPPSTMNVEQFVRETLIVSRHLCRELDQRKIYLLGHSWGTLPAILAAQREPDLFQAYIGMGQLVDIDESERRLTKIALDYAEKKGEPRKAAALRSVGPPPYLSLAAQDRAADLITRLFPPVSHPATRVRLGLLALSSRYYPFPEILRANAGYRFSRAIIDPKLHQCHLRQMVPGLGIPAFFFVGRNDSTFGIAIQEDYYRHLVAPRGKRFIVFEDSTHWPYLEQPDAFLAEMRKVRAATWSVPELAERQLPPEQDGTERAVDLTATSSR